MMKKALFLYTVHSATIASLLALAIMTSTADAADVVDGVTLSALSDTTAEVVLGDVFYTDMVTVPATDAAGRRVTAVGYAAFNACHALKGVSLPDGITVINDYAFNSCDVLTTLTLPASLIFVGDHAFARCEAIKEFVLPDRVTHIGDYGFFRCRQAVSITLGKAVSHIGKKAFVSCNQLKTINVAEGNTTYRDIDGTLFSADGSTLFAFPRKHTNWRDYTVPAGVKHIADYAFYGCDNTRSIALPSDVTDIGESAFANCRLLAEIVLPAGLETLGVNAFDGCRSLKKVHCRAAEPMPLDADLTPFGFFTDLSAATLFVPIGSAWLYATAPVWASFGEIVEETPAAVEPTFADHDIPTISTDGHLIIVDGVLDDATLTLYDMQGRMVAHAHAGQNTILAPAPGIYIVRVAGSEHSAQKVLVK